MDHFAGLDVSVKDTSVCIVDDTGKITREVKVASEPDALLALLTNPDYHFKRVGLEAGPLSQWLFSALAEAWYGWGHFAPQKKTSLFAVSNEQSFGISLPGAATVPTR
jgi:hypothetical protein